MVGSSQRRAVVAWARTAYQVGERRACRTLAVHRAMIRYEPVKPDDAPVRRRLHELAKDRPSFGAKRLHVMLRREGLRLNHKKTHRLYIEEGLQLKPRRRRRRSATLRQPRAIVTQPNERWAMDFMHDVLATGQRVRVFILVDVYTRECIALEAARSFSGDDVTWMLSDAGVREGGAAADRRVRQRDGVHLDGARSLSPLESGTARLQPTWQTRGQRGLRGVQRQPET